MVELKIAQGSDHMSWLEFVSSLTASLAWPVAAIIIAIMFKAQIAALLDKIRAFSWGDKKIDFSDKLDKIETAARESTVEQPLIGSQVSTPDQTFQQLLKISPSATVLYAWRPVQTKLRQMGAERGYESAVLKSPFQTMKKLRTEKVIAPDIYETLRDLQRLRNAAAHQQEVTIADAIRFHDLAIPVLKTLEKSQGSSNRS